MFVFADAAGVEWQLTVSEIRSICKEHARRGNERWKYLLGCKRCKRIWTEVTPCPCSLMQKNQRLYDLEGNFMRIAPMREFITWAAVHQAA